MQSNTTEFIDPRSLISLNSIIHAREEALKDKNEKKKWTPKKKLNLKLYKII